MIDFSMYKYWLPNVVRLGILLWTVALVIFLFIILFPFLWWPPIINVLKESDGLLQRALEF